MTIQYEFYDINGNALLERPADPFIPYDSYITLIADPGHILYHKFQDRYMHQVKVPEYCLYYFEEVPEDKSN